jgi:hypothetical protein
LEALVAREATEGAVREPLRATDRLVERVAEGVMVWTEEVQAGQVELVAQAIAEAGAAKVGRAVVLQALMRVTMGEREAAEAREAREPAVVRTQEELVGREGREA